MLKKVRCFLYQNKITSKGNRIIKILNIPVLYKKVKKKSL